MELQPIMITLKYCPKDCGKATFCHKGEPLPEDKTVCYSLAFFCGNCGLPSHYWEGGKLRKIPTPKRTEQFWRGRVCQCIVPKNSKEVEKL